MVYIFHLVYAVENVTSRALNISYIKANYYLHVSDIQCASIFVIMEAEETIYLFNLLKTPQIQLVCDVQWLTFYWLKITFWGKRWQNLETSPLYMSYFLPFHIQIHLMVVMNQEETLPRFSLRNNKRNFLTGYLGHVSYWVLIWSVFCSWLY